MVDWGGVSVTEETLERTEVSEAGPLERTLAERNQPLAF
ncbi:hypothetical protein BFZC1_15865 [Lysinibacillus fusiformis ZC1]|nr:hypothetical protein BFZC1_15865 [Lysinibacillus fusiformis ZC1]